MGRWEPNARGRLEKAALELFDEQGFDQTTVAQIAARAGLTERTFFRHFADKPEVLFQGQELLRQELVDSLSEAPADVDPMGAIARAFGHVATMFAGRREFAGRRQAVVSASAELRERELNKLQHLADALAAILRRRGVAEPAATLSAEAGVTVFRVAFELWIAGPDRELVEVMDESFAELRALAAGPAR